MDRYTVARWAPVVAAVGLLIGAAGQLTDKSWVLGAVLVGVAVFLLASAPAARRTTDQQRAADRATDSDT